MQKCADFQEVLPSSFSGFQLITSDDWFQYLEVPFSTSKHLEGTNVVHMLLKCACRPLYFIFEKLLRGLVGDMAARWTVNDWVQDLILAAD